KEETEFVRCYLEIEQVRFGDRLTVEFQIEPATFGAQVPHLILQPVVENAIQHAIAPRATPGAIQVAARQTNGLLRLEVTDDGPGLTTSSNALENQGLGLKNVRARLEQLYGNLHCFEVSNRPEG